MKNKKKLLIYSAVFVVIAALGAAGGIIAKKTTSSPETDYSGFNIDSVKPNVQSIMNKYNGYKGNTPETYFTAGELINIAQEKFRTCENCFSLGKGVGNTVMTQEIRNYQIKNGNKYFEESISKSIGSIMGISVALANRCYQEGETITKYSAKKENVTIEYSTYETESTKFALKDYKESMGKTLDEMFIYIISDNIIKEKSVTKDTDGSYLVDITLDNDLSVYNYIHQMKTISALDKFPTFSLVNLKYKISKDLNLLSMDVHEVYKATMVGVPASIDQTINYVYFANQKLDIPEINDALDYSLLQ